MKILLVEDDQPTGSALTEALMAHHYTVNLAIDGQTGLELAQACEYDLVLLDIVIPKLDGIQVCQRLRAGGYQGSILLLTAKDSSGDRVMGLDAGADDYVVKPFDMAELFARIRALSRRGREIGSSILTWGNVQLDTVHNEVICDGQTVHFTPKEYCLLELFLYNPKRIFSRRAILDRLWDFANAPGEETVSTHIKSVRQKLKTAGAADMIETVYGLGYRLHAPSPTPDVPPSLSSATVTTPAQNPSNNHSQTTDAKADAKAQIQSRTLQVWNKYKTVISDQVKEVEQAAHALESGCLSAELRVKAQQQAHKLTGSLGIFGLKSGSELARELEQQFQNPTQTFQGHTPRVETIAALTRSLRRCLDQESVAKTTPNPQHITDTPLLMIVDDDLALADCLRIEAMGWGFQVEVANDLAVAREMIAQTPPNIVLLDLNFPGAPRAGLTLLAELSNHVPPVPVIAFSGQHNELDQQEVSQLGGYAFLPKTLSTQAIFETITAALLPQPELKPSENREFEALYNDAPCGYHALDREGMFLRVNDTELRMLGYSRTEMIGKKFTDLLAPESLPIFQANFPRFKETGWVQDLEFHMVCKDGSILPVSLSSRAIKDTQGDYLCSWSIMLDIRDRQRIKAERTRAEAELQQAKSELEQRVAERTRELAEANDRLQSSEAKLNEILNGAIAVIVNFRYFADHRVEYDYISSGCKAIFGYGAPDLLADPNLWRSRVHPDDVATIVESSHAAIVSEQTIKLEYRFYHKDGHWRWVTETLSSRRNETENCWIVTAVDTDITDQKQAELSLLESEERFRQLAENLQDVIWVADAFNGKTLYVNRAYETIWRRKREDLYQDFAAWFQAIAPEDREQTQQNLEIAVENGFYDAEYRIVQPDGTLRWIRDRGFPIKDATGEIYRIAGIAEDITEQKQSKENLYKRQQEFIALVENSPDIVARFSLDLRYIYINPAVERATSVPMDSFLGKTNRELGFPEDLIQELDKIQQGVIETGQEAQTEYAFLTPHGQRFFQTRFVPERESDGSISSILGITHDITTLQQKEATLRESERRWRSLLDNVRLIVVELNLMGQVEYVNPFFLTLTGYKAAEVIGQNWFNTFLPPAEQPQVQRTFQELLTQDFHPHYRNPILTRSGSEKMIAWNNTLLHNEQGDVIGTISIGEDITQRVALDRIKNEFVSVVSHELRTPLTSLRGSLGLLASGVYAAKPDKSKRMLDVAAQSANRLVRLVDDILDLERLESGKIALVMNHCAVIPLLEQAVEALRGSAEQNQITVVINPLNTQNSEVWAAADAVIQTLTNLLSNAIKFSESGSTIWLSAERVTMGGSMPMAPNESNQPSDRCDLFGSHPYIVFRLKDQGRGIPPQHLETIFGRFQQVDVSDAREKGGTGLGLAICRTIVHQHGGEIWAESIEGEGSTFSFVLPIHVPATNHQNP